MHQGSVRRSDPGHEAAPVSDARPVALSRLGESVNAHARVLQLEREMERLQKRCDDLDGFAQAVAHDLRSPLGSVDAFSNLLEESLEGLSGPEADEARHWASRVRAAARQMDELIEGLQALAQVSRKPMKIEPMDLSGLARQILDRMAQEHPRPPIDATVAPDLRASGDPRLIRQLLENLLDNARKFSALKPRVQIEVGWQAPGGAWPAGAFFVRDYGVGFDMKRTGPLFEPYGRLHSSDEFAGYGLGLALVRRIVNRHGGTVAAQSQPGQGTTIYFTWHTTEGPVSWIQQGA